MKIEKYNPWWKNNKVPTELKGRPRKIIKKLITSIANTREISILYGIRGGGKTVLLYQLIDYLITRKKVNPEHILYFSFKTEHVDLDLPVSLYRRKLKFDFIQIPDTIYFFFDSIERVKNWKEKIKTIFENNPNIKIFIAISFLPQDLNRWFPHYQLYHITPLTFKEYIEINLEKKVDYKTITPGAKIFRDIEAHLDDYIKHGGFWKIINKREELEIEEYLMEQLLEKIVWIDLPQIFNVDNPFLAYQIVKEIFSHPGILFDYKYLGEKLGADRRTVEEYVKFLRAVDIIGTVYNYSGKLTNLEKKSKRFYASYISFVNHDYNLLMEDNNGIANIIYSNFRPKYFFRTPDKREVDFIFEENDKLIPVQVKYIDYSPYRNLSCIRAFLRNYNCKYGIVITKDIEDKWYSRKEKIRFIPLIKFLLTFSQSIGITSFINTSQNLR